MGAVDRYDRIGVGYRAVRRTDPVLASRIWAVLGDARTVLNVGAGTGSYEPLDRWVLAVEPSGVMIAQRPPDAAPVIQAPVERLPLADRTVDAAMAVLTLQHWDDLETGLRELMRVVRDRVVLVTMDFETLGELWLVRDYLPELLDQHAARFPTMARLRDLLPNSQVQVLPVPRECEDGFMAAFWARPHAYLDPTARAATSPWHDLPVAVVEHALAQLREHLGSGDWQRRHGHLLARAELDVGLRLITASR
ncbi:MAG TPA: methyltransferase domain-containing protein [Solirubrobacteraceae bacterium]|jgi:SAM-dependent methyltransferase|nr:methyltransferase domain-containing protein [Solirubrobacteraceae bacterium]